MSQPGVQPKSQERWNQYGKGAIQEMLQNRTRFLVHDSPYRHLQVHQDLMRALSPVEGRRVLELGSGLGRFSVFLAKQGVRVTGVDVGPDLVAASALLAEINGVGCEFQVANIVELPFKANSYDLVLGVMILHHLSTSELQKAAAEAHRVLKPNGRAVFYESVENSRLFDWIQNLFPAGKKGSSYWRPSILQREPWRSYQRGLDDRDLTSRELVAAGKHFSASRLRPYGLLIRLERVLGARFRGGLVAIDEFLLRRFRPVGYLSQTVLVEYWK